jgi:hypothetical protein
MQYSVVVLGATGNVGGRIVQLLTRRKTSSLSPKVFNEVVSMDPSLRLASVTGPFHPAHFCQPCALVNDSLACHPASCTVMSLFQLKAALVIAEGLWNQCGKLYGGRIWDSTHLPSDRISSK